MQENRSEFIRANWYIIAGLLSGCGVGVMAGSSLVRTNLGGPVFQGAIPLIGLSLIMVGANIIGYLRRKTTPPAVDDTTAGQ